MLKRTWGVMLCAALCLVLLLMPIPANAAEGIEINETNFPDANFRNYLLGEYYGRDGILTEKEIDQTKWLWLASMEIQNLQGIEYFTALETLDCNDNQLTSLNVSGCTALQKLYCSGNQLTSLDVSGCTALQTLYCSDNQLTSLDVSGCTALQGLSCFVNQLTSLDVSGCTALQTLWCNGNQLTSLDLSQNEKIINLLTDGNEYTVHLGTEKQLDLTTLPGNFDVSRASYVRWHGQRLHSDTYEKQGFLQLLS